ncbi:hypothetical protein [Xanthobacter autotrophicus]|uniref:hypothetical protein n=1 Tax=Xanthobacter autotrophicus TaxID=280 RepID=UPI00372B65A5
MRANQATIFTIFVAFQITNCVDIGNAQGSFMFGGSAPPSQETEDRNTRNPAAPLSESQIYNPLPTPSLDETIRFITNTFDRAASLTKANFFLSRNATKPVSQSYFVRIYIRKLQNRQLQNDFELFFYDSRSANSRFLYYENGKKYDYDSSLEYYHGFRYSYAVFYRDIIIEFRNSEKYIHDDEMTYMQGVAFVCKVGSCVNGEIPEEQDRRALLFPIVQDDIMRRLAKALVYLGKYIDNIKDPF